jgi:hypothetical protein
MREMDQRGQARTVRTFRELQEYNLVETAVSKLTDFDYNASIQAPSLSARLPIDSDLDISGIIVLQESSF